MTSDRLTRVLDSLEGAARLDPAIERVQSAVRAALPPGRVRDLLHGVPLGHPAHPFLVQLPMGAWLSAAILDRVPGQRIAAGLLVGVGTVSALPAIVAGAADWSELHPQQLRVGFVHAVANAAATGLYAASLVQRLRGRASSGRRLALLGLATASLGGYLGGHLAYRQASGANHSEDVPHRFPPGWHPIGLLSELPDRRLTRRSVEGEPILLYRSGERLYALSDTCSHLSGPLAEGTLTRGDDGPCVECPWHGSVFSLEDGSVRRGPATSPQPVFSVRVVGGLAEVMLPGAG